MAYQLAGERSPVRMQVAESETPHITDIEVVGADVTLPSGGIHELCS